MSLDEIKRRRAEDPAARDKVLEATKKDIKERNLKKVQAKKADKAKVKAPAAASKAPAPKAAPKVKVSAKGKR